MGRMDVSGKYRIDRSSLTISKLTDRQNDRAYWLSKTPAERFEALEYLRQLVYGYDPATARLQRVLEIVDLHDLK